mgnify:CR=1 FL=1
MSSKIYEEALAEAKQLREIAEQNAKNAIVEAVTPKIREFIDNQLMGETSQSTSSVGVEEILSESLGLASEEEVVLDESAIQSLASLLGSSGSSKEVLNMLAESINDLEPNQADLVLSAAKKLDETSNNFKSNKISRDVSDLQENTNMASNEKIYEVDLSLLKEELSRTNLNEVGDDEPEEADSDEAQNEEKELREMLSDLGLLQEDKIEIDLGEDVELPEDIQIVARLLADEEDDLEGDLEIEDEVMDVEGDDDEVIDDLDVSLDEVIEIDANVLKEELLRMKRLIREAKAKSLADAKGGIDSKEASWGGSGHANAGLNHSYGGKGSGKGQNAFGGGTEKGDVYKVKLNSLKETLRKELRKNRTLETRLDEYRSAVETLREQLTDLNLFNAKLLYVNKLFQDKSVTPTRRRAMMESIDSAKSLREVKLIYKTLTGSPARGSKRLNESTKRTLGSSSRKVGRSSATSTNSEVDRWAILAGIKNN